MDVERVDDKSKSQPVRRLMAIVVSACVALAVGEGLLRMAGFSRQYVNPLHSFHQHDELVGHRGKPNFQGRFKTIDFDVVIEHDENGFRRQVNQHSPRDPSQRLFVFGDSFTWGWGVAQGQVYSDRMSELLQDHEVVNLGLNASGTVHQHALFERHVKQQLQSGNIVMVTFCGNDFSDNVRGSLHGEVHDGQVKLVGPEPFGWEAKDWLKDHCYLFNLAAFHFDQFKSRRKHESGANRAVQQLVQVGRQQSDIAVDAPEVIVTSEFLKRFRDDCRQQQASFYVAAIADDPVLRHVTSELGIELIELFPHFQRAIEQGRAERFTFEHDAHWNAAGHGMAAEVLADFILARESQATAEVAERASGAPR